jgi:hypothetical protein
VNISGVNVNGTGINSNGGGLWISNCGNISIINSGFDNMNVSGNGGGIYLGEGTYFSLINSKFSNLKAGGYGGAIYANSGVDGERVISNVQFISNTAGNTNSGNDIYDGSVNGHGYYSTSSVNTSSSTSFPSQFMVIGNSLARIYDCLLSIAGCGYNTAYVSESGGFDYILCGQVQSSPCLTITKAYVVLSGDVGIVVVNPGNYLNTVVNILNQNLVISGVNSPIGNTQLLSVVSLNAPLEGVVAVVDIGANGQGLFTNLSFIWTSFAEVSSNVRIFYLRSNSSVVVLESCLFSRNASSIYGQTVALIESRGSMVAIVDSIFTNIALSVLPLVLVDTTNVSPVITVNGTTFSSIETQGECASILSVQNSGNVYLNIENTILQHITNSNHQNERGGVIYIFGELGTQFGFNSNIVNNITVGSTVDGGGLCIDGSFESISLSYSNFTDIESGSRGGCLFFGISGIGNGASTIISNCLFSMSGSFYGGGVYIENILVYFSQVQFSGNSGFFF